MGLVFKDYVLQAHGFMLMFTEEYHMCYLINIIRKQLPFFLADGRHDSRIYYIFSDSEPDMMGHGRYPMPKLGEELPSRGRPYLIPVKPAITRCDNRINVVLAF